MLILVDCVEGARGLPLLGSSEPVKVKLEYAFHSFLSNGALSRNVRLFTVVMAFDCISPEEPLRSAFLPPMTKDTPYLLLI